MSHPFRGSAWGPLLTIALAATFAAGQESSTHSVVPAADLPLREFLPEPSLRVKSSEIHQAKFPIVDVHTHFRVRRADDPESLKNFVQLMDRRGIAVCVSLDGGTGDALREHCRQLEAAAPGRFLVFATLDFRQDGIEDRPETWACNRPDFVRDSVERLRQAAADGAVGLKLFKDFGLTYRDAQGRLLQVDDERFDPIWQVCGDLGLPVLMHTADPSAFFRPIDAKNERYEELARRPEWSFYGKDFPSRESLHEARNRVIARHPNTIFIAAHLANDGEDLAQVSAWLDQYPNLYVELASRISELGRQPYTSRRFLTRYRDRILFGTDGPWPEERIVQYVRFLETDDEYFPYSERPFPPQGFWRIYGVYLDDETLKAIYHGNAMRLFPGIRAQLEKPD